MPRGRGRGRGGRGHGGRGGGHGRRRGPVEPPPVAVESVAKGNGTAEEGVVVDPPLVGGQVETPALLRLLVGEIRALRQQASAAPAAVASVAAPVAPPPAPEARMMLREWIGLRLDPFCWDPKMYLRNPLCILN